MHYRSLFCSVCIQVLLCFSLQGQAIKQQNSQNQNFVEIKGTSCYIDMGVLYGYVQQNFMIWWPEPVSIDQAKLDNFLDPLFAELANNRFNLIELAFTQLQDIDALLSGDAGSPTDTITPILKDNYPVGNTGENFLHYLVSRAHQQNIGVSLSFGGAIATPNDWALNSDGAAEAHKLVEFLGLYQLDGADFDIESFDIMNVNPQEQVVDFFSTLYDSFSDSHHLTLTVMGDVNVWAGHVLEVLFADLKQLFNAVNLMLYSSTEYYIDADNPTWGIQQWLTHVPDSTYLHIGFYDSIPYENPDASGGKRYPVEGLTRGQAAACIYLNLLQDLGMSIEQFGDPFWWTDQPTKITGNAVFSDFYTYLSSH